MKYRERLIAFAVVLTTFACERAALPTAAVESTGPLFAAGVAGRFKSFRVPTDNSEPRHITLGSDGNMWFTESNIDVSQIARIDASGRITEFVVPTRLSQPDDIVAGPDGAVWFTAVSGFPDFFIGRVTTDGQFTGFAPPCDNPDEACSIVPNGITSGPDGNIWFTENLRNAVVKLTPSGVFTFFTIPTLDANPHGITVGPDGAIWFAEFNGKKIGRINPFDRRGRIAEFGPVTGSPDRITAGPDGNLWFTEPAAEQLSQITPDGVITPVQRVRGGPWGIGRGSDGAIWMTQMTGNSVARFTLR
jgi:virginiamycin B lyase